MRNMLVLFVTVTVFSAFSGGLLTVLERKMADRIEYQELKFVRGPAIRKVMEGSSNDPLVDRFKLKEGDKEKDFYVGVFKGKPDVVAVEGFGKGFDAEIGVMVGINLNDDKIVGIGVTTNSETPGVGSRVKTDPTFNAQFKGASVKNPFKIKADGGKFDALSGASFSSRGVCAAIFSASETYLKMKAEILKNVKKFAS